MIGIALALVAGYGVFLLYTAVVLGWRGVGFGPAAFDQPLRDRRHVARVLDEERTAIEI